jgi:hypothetical protein
MNINVDMKDLRLEKSLEALYDECIAEMPPTMRKKCIWAVKTGQLISSMKDETNEQLAIDMGFKGSCKGCDCGCKK